MGSRNFFPDGYELKDDVPTCLRKSFNLSQVQLDKIVAYGFQFPAEQMTRDHASAIYAFTCETPNIYRRLNSAMRNPAYLNGAPIFAPYRDYIRHLWTALQGRENFCGKAYRGIRTRLPPELFKAGDAITWQSFSSATMRASQTRTFVATEELTAEGAVKAVGSIFIISATSAKKIEQFSNFPAEKEVLFLPNSQFRMRAKVSSENQKLQELRQLRTSLGGNVNMTELDVYLLDQIA
eukprot:4245148-Pleurochrysis_carterae.AAC.2